MIVKVGPMESKDGEQQRKLPQREQTAVLVRVIQKGEREGHPINPEPYKVRQMLRTDIFGAFRAALLPACRNEALKYISSNC